MAKRDAEDVACQAAVDAWIFTFQSTLAKAGSPLERALFWALLSQCDCVDHTPVFGCEADTPAWIPRGPYTWVTSSYGEVFVLVPQFEVGAYRLDFALVHLRHAFGKRDKPSVWLDIECDGHDFHERTKEQAERDKRRDRDLQAAGWRVARFTGSEIHRNPVLTAEKVFKMAHDLLGYSDPRH